MSKKIDFDKARTSEKSGLNYAIISLWIGHRKQPRFQLDFKSVAERFS